MPSHDTTSPMPEGRIAIVGLGPGGLKHMTVAARDALDDSETILGYRGYVNLVISLLDGKEVLSSGMRQEMERAEKAIELAAAGKKVAVVCSGDAGIYGMASPTLERLYRRGDSIEVRIIPGVPSPQSAASLLGAPLAHDYAVISLSDLLTPWEQIAKRVSLAATGDFVIVLLNPASSKRTWQIKEARRLILEHRTPATPVGIVTNAYREDQKVTITTLATLPDHKVDMMTTLVIGNSTTFTHGNRIITPRGYK